MHIIFFSQNKNFSKNPIRFAGNEKKSAFIIDCDGTLINSTAPQKESWQQTANKIAEDFSRPYTSVDPFYNHGASGAENLNAIFKNLKLENCPEDIKMGYRQVKIDLYKTILNNTAAQNGPDSLLIEGARKFLEKMRKKLPELNFILASNGLGATSAIQAAQLDDFFTKLSTPPTLIDGQDKGKLFKLSKPEPDIFLAAANLTGVTPGNCVVFEDSIEGITAAIKARMKFMIIGGLITPNNDLKMGEFKNFSEIYTKQLIKYFTNLR